MNPQTNPPPKNLKKEIAAGFVIFRKAQEGLKFLLLYHGGQYWNFPKGKIEIEAEEKSLDAAIRETREETGLRQSNLRIIKGFKSYERFYFKRKGQPTFKIVIFYLAETNVADIKISREHHGYGWFSYEDARKILGKYKDTLKVLEQAHSSLKQRARPAHDQRTLTPRRQ